MYLLYKIFVLVIKIYAFPSDTHFNFITPFIFNSWKQTVNGKNDICNFIQKWLVFNLKDMKETVF